MKTFRVVLRRANGRFVKEKEVYSRYAAKEQKRRWEEKYDEATYYVEIVRPEAAQ